MSLPGTIKQQIEAIRADNSHGAAYLAQRAAETLGGLAALAEASPAIDLKAQLTLAARALVEAQPTMAPLFNLANETLWSLENVDEPAAIREAVADTTQSFSSRLERASQAIATAAVDLIADISTVLTYSASTTVLAALKHAYAAGRSFDVICTESRPVGEGIELATALGQAGLRVRLIIDAAVYSYLPEVQLILVGADSLSAGGLVNKTGTLGLAIAARTFNIALYALCSSAKFLPVDYTPPPEPPKDPAEIVAGPLDNVTVLNYYFDHTPVTYLTGVVTEGGILSMPEVQQQFQALNSHPALRS